MREQFIPELGLKLSGEKLDIWLGYDENNVLIQMSMHEREITKNRWVIEARMGTKKSDTQVKERVRRPCGCGKSKSITTTSSVAG